MKILNLYNLPTWFLPSKYTQSVSPAVKVYVLAVASVIVVHATSSTLDSYL